MQRAYKKFLLAWLAAILLAGTGAACPVAHQAVTGCEFIFATAPFASSHASTLVDTPRGLLAAWFGGSREGANDVQIWTARRENASWSRPTARADGAQPDGTREPTWNPVLFRGRDGTVRLFYHVGRSPKSWRGMLMTSRDEGVTWSAPAALPHGVMGPVKNKPIALADGTILAPSSTEENGWHVHVESSSDGGATWRATGALNPDDLLVIQPTLLDHGNGRIQMLVRNGRRRPDQPHRILEAWSADGGRTWTPLQATALPNPDSGIDAARLRDGRAVLAFNDTERGRSPLKLALSADAGRTWTRALTLEDEPRREFSYPSVIEDANGMVQITYTWKRERITHVTIDPRRF